MVSYLCDIRVYRTYHLIRLHLGLEQSRSPYSKSHERRLKRRAREQVAGGLNDIKAALAAVEGEDIPAAVQASVSTEAILGDTAGALESSRPKKVKSKPGQIGEGKGVPLSKNQRKRALYVSHSPVLHVAFGDKPGDAHVTVPLSRRQLERARIPMILATPDFASDPFQTIRTHAQNTLLKHSPPALS